MEKYPCLSNRFFNHTEKIHPNNHQKHTSLVNPSTSGKVNLVDFPSTKIEFTPAFQLFPEEKAREPRTSFSKDFGSVHGALVWP